MDHALTTWLAVNGPFSAPGAVVLGGSNAVLTGIEDVPLSLLMFSSKAYCRSSQSIDEFEHDLRELIGPNAIVDYELLIQRSKLVEYLDGPAASIGSDTTEYLLLSDYLPERKDEMQSFRNELQSALLATHGPIVSVSARTVFQYTVSSFIDLVKHDARDYLFSMLVAARQLLKGIGELPYAPVEIRDDFALLFIDAYQDSLMSGVPVLWAERICRSLCSALRSYIPGDGANYACTDDDISAFIFGFSGPIQGPQTGSLFYAQVKQGLGMSVAMMPEELAIKLKA